MDKTLREKALEAARAAAAGNYTAGPWQWFGNTDVHYIYLATIDRGRRFVMQFKRYGFRNAQPEFQQYTDETQERGYMVKADDLALFEVDKTGKVVGSAAAKEAKGIYRRDIIGFDNPHAKLIEAAWTIPLLLEEIDATATLQARVVELEAALGKYTAMGDDLQEFAAQQPECDWQWAEAYTEARRLLEPPHV